MKRDPVCEMKVDENEAEHITIYRGMKYYFCSADCKRAFDLAPEKYAKEEPLEKVTDPVEESD